MRFCSFPGLWGSESFGCVLLGLFERRLRRFQARRIVLCAVGFALSGGVVDA
ncbi:MAG: hypothetical protein JWR57_1193, partial [Mycetocola sp.]|nr:hypothetical protein [Mycetocola sp.]